jgi:hypothetical protein
MAVGLPAKTTYVDGDVFSASDINDTNGTINLIGQTTNFYAGKNRIINGDFNIWQRGTSTTLTNNVHGFGADRFRAYLTFSAGSASFSQQTFTPGAAPVAGYESSFFGRVTCGSTSTYAEISQKIENVRTFAGQSATLSFWAKASASLVFTPYLIQQFGSGGSADVATAGSNITLTTSWTRYTVPLTIPSISGKTIGTGSVLLAIIAYASGTLNSATIDTWGWQVEAGSVATAFQISTGSFESEFAACKRYFQSSYPFGSAPGTAIGGIWTSIETAEINRVILPLQFPVEMRATPTLTAYSPATGASGNWYNRTAAADKTVSSFAANSNSFLFNTLSTNQTAGNQMIVNYTASAEL